MLTDAQIDGIFQADLILHDLGILERAWRRYQREHPGPLFTPTMEQLPHFAEIRGDLQIALC